MKLPHPPAAIAVLAVMAGFSASRAFALVTLEDGLDKVFVDGSFGVAYDSNVFANSASGGSATESATLTIEFVRDAGWIGVNASLGWSATDFASDPGQDYLDPLMSLELTKQSGRTTGSLLVSAQREDRADVDVNTRDTSWNYAAGLNFRYPVIESYSLSGGFNYSYVDYLNRQLFTNMATYSANMDLYYILSDARDLFGGYRYTYSEGANNTYDVDHDVHLGVSGRILPKINGSISVGYGIRIPHGNDALSGTGDFADYTASGSATWTVNRKIAVTGDISRDFGFTATDVSTDATTASVSVTDSLTAKLSFTGSVGGGETRYLGVGGEISPGGPQRTDWSVNASAAVNYTLNSHLKASLGYNYFRNWSTFDFAAFPREQWNFNVSSHW